MNKYLVKFILPIFVQVLSTMTPMFRKQIIESLHKLQETAKQTPNPLDDIVVEMLLSIMHVPEMTGN